MGKEEIFGKKVKRIILNLIRGRSAHWSLTGERFFLHWCYFVNLSKKKWKNLFLTGLMVNKARFDKNPSQAGEYLHTNCKRFL